MEGDFVREMVWRGIDGDDDRSAVENSGAERQPEIFQPYLSALPLPYVRKSASKAPTVFPLDEPARSFVVLKRAKADEITCT